MMFLALARLPGSVPMRNRCVVKEPGCANLRTPKTLRSNNPIKVEVEAKVKVERLSIHHKYHRFFNEQLPIINEPIDQLTN
jgi:hypothetical protein